MADDDETSLEEQTEVQEESETVVTSTIEGKPLDPPKYEVRPGLGEKFQSQAVQEIILRAMGEQLAGRQYRPDLAPAWANKISNAVRHLVQELNMKRYKIIVQTTIIEMKGAGVKCAQRLIWDPETDAYIDDTFRNDTLLCHTIVYGVYMY
ncbi:hypothetical protein JYU34_010859 [Plutella xylostella]|uniref:Uncharacterized protein n=2 Tax=Plutella xylostella TaxID=51655 RepID=A0ABQ7QGN2_PLUXY|nr:dynein light chain Tctex-type protein 2B [Plutella xylostella]KAG7303945.1 hypothetical protein JYU34_010859 [Plutella xylostella]CAG9110062.1 unnamed protein product [Plutella xylostella]